MNRKGSFSNSVKPKATFRKGSIDQELGRKGSMTGSNIPKKFSMEFGRMSKVSLGHPSMALTPLKNFITPTKSKSDNKNLLLGPESCSRLSMRASGFNMHGKKIPWVITDPSFKTKCIETIFDFLLLKNLDSNITKNTLKSPTAKEFSLIFTFIYQFLDPYFKLNKIEDQIPKLIKKLGFPGHLTRSTFLNVGSPHAWPSVLAMLSWLCNIISIDSDSFDVIENMFQKDSFDKNSSENKIAMDCYLTAFSNQDQILELFQEYKLGIMSRNGICEQDFQDLLLCQDEFVQLIESTPNKSQEISEMKERYSKLESDYEKLVQYEEKIIVVLKEKGREQIEISNQLGQIKTSINEIYDDIENIKNLKKNQQFSDDQLKKIKSYKEKHFSSIEFLKHEENDLKQKQWKTECEFSKLRNNWNNSVCEVSTKCLHLGIDSSFLSNGDLENFNSNKDKSGGIINQFLDKLEVSNVNFSCSKTDLQKEANKISDIYNASKTTLAKLEKTSIQLNKENQELSELQKTENDRIQTELEKYSEEILMVKRGSEVNMCNKNKRETLWKEFKALADEKKIERKNTVRILTTKRSNVEWFLKQKEEMTLEHNEDLHKIYALYLQKKKEFNLVFNTDL